MKTVTIALLGTIEKRSGLTAAQLEAKFGLGLQGVHDLETGQEWRRYRHSQSTRSKENQALSIRKLWAVAGLALDLRYVTHQDLWSLGLYELGNAEDLRVRLDNERAALKIFQRGIANLSTGKMPLPPGGSKGGRPRAASSSSEAAESFQKWVDRIHDLGCCVFEDRAEVAEQDALLFQRAQEEERPFGIEDYRSLPEWAQPFDPRYPDGGALSRLRIRFSFGRTDEPWFPQYSLPYGVHWSPDMLALNPAATNAEANLFFEQFEQHLRSCSAPAALQGSP
ncbi:hypothetical protein [Cupriavidus basilensis]|uniref:hypothetical protein n=1 Tax=Cupriavidus basilensis TaxID=68895 RepID=UPI00157A2AD0|nr:hypothetical protein [Cupriavidus basilensis]NUA26314.1 hypothetical protein [Cupriavidus basilensis]